MAKICVLQTDNRLSLDYLLKTQKVNKKFCDVLKYDYLFIDLNIYIKKHKHFHPATWKIFVLNDILEKNNYDILVFLDSDAWIQNGYWLNDIIMNLINNPEKHGCFSRDPYLKHNTFINSGSFIIKNNEFTKNMYKNIISDLNNNPKYYRSWPYDQHYISKIIFENKENFVIFVPDILNTPIGKVLRHNWLKNKEMHNDLNELILQKNEDLSIYKTNFIMSHYIDQVIFPNTNVFGYDYMK
jgi:hypothetical protein